jgi:hypothetical protein
MVLWKLRLWKPMCPTVPAARPRYCAPGAWAASSITVKPCSAEIAMISSRRAGQPKMSTTTIALVRA